MELFKKTTSNFIKVPNKTFMEDHLENQLEEWIQNNPCLLGNLLIIKSQVHTSRSQIIDLLAIDENSSAVVIELKRGKTPRDVLAQVTGYISCIQEWKYDDFEYLMTGSNVSTERILAKKFREHFNRDLDRANLCSNPRAIIIAEKISPELLQDFKQSRFPVTIYEFSYFVNDEKEEYLLLSEMGSSGDEPKVIKTKERPRAGIGISKKDDDEDNLFWSSGEACKVFFEFYARIEHLLNDVFRPEEGWRVGKSRAEAHVVYSKWKHTWEGFSLDVDYNEETKKPEYFISVYLPTNFGKLLLPKLKKDESILKNMLGNNYELEETGWQRIYEYVSEDPKTIAERMAVYKKVLTPYLDEILPKR
ncbi:MAG: hypothetical protein A2297_04975 [Elusimicrobia bacterium RIFOXYB2_FULL_48_7]|nr:MAG: hypothetical protein A2297_04975 [Elusimicrobia bacterium RIFOXYB2_FULL_48_7]